MLLSVHSTPLVFQYLTQFESDQIKIIKLIRPCLYFIYIKKCTLFFGYIMKGLVLPVKHHGCQFGGTQRRQLSSAFPATRCVEPRTWSFPSIDTSEHLLTHQEPALLSPERSVAEDKVGDLSVHNFLLLVVKKHPWAHSGSDTFCLWWPQKMWPL